MSGDQLDLLFRHDAALIESSVSRVAEKFSMSAALDGSFNVEPSSAGAAEIARDVYAFPFLDQRWCNELVRFAELVNAYEQEKGDMQFAAPEVRLNRLSPVLAGIFHRYVTTYIAPIVFSAWQIWPGIVHPPFVTRYDPNTQRGLPVHHDNLSDVTLSVSLNDSYEGGGLYFERQQLEVARRPIGSALLFPGKVTHRHSALDVTGGQRFVLTTWMQHDEPYIT